MSDQSQRSGLNRRPHLTGAERVDGNADPGNGLGSYRAASEPADRPEDHPKTVPDSSLNSRFEITEAGRAALAEPAPRDEMRREHAIELVTRARERVSDGNAAWQTWTWLLEQLQLAAAPIKAEPLTPRQGEVLRFVARRLLDRNLAPTQAEIADEFHLKSLATVHEILGAIERKGYIARLYNTARAIELTPIGRAWIARAAA